MEGRVSVDTTLTDLLGRCHMKESLSCSRSHSSQLTEYLGNISQLKYNLKIKILALELSPRSRYRSYSGACNSVRLPGLGASLTELGRLLPPEYSDGISQPRAHSVSKGEPLPNPRAVSSTILERLEQLDPQYNLMVMQWGQFIDHDFAMVPQYRGDTHDCCLFSKSGSRSQQQPDRLLCLRLPPLSPRLLPHPRAPTRHLLPPGSSGQQTVPQVPPVSARPAETRAP